MIQIKNPCDASWQEMTSAASGKYCGSCEKVVVDFSKMSDAQIENYFTEYASQKICGRFLDSQLNRPLKVSASNNLSKIGWGINRLPVFKSFMLIWASSVLWLTNCVSKDRTTGEVDVQTCDSIISEDTVSTITYLELDSLLITGNVTTYKPDKPEIVPLVIPATTKDGSDTILHVIKGKVMMTDTISQKIKQKKK
jgi:hypothetical protein